NFLVRRPPGLKINLFTLNENALCHESPRRARKKFHAPGLFCSGSPSPPGAEVTYHQQFGNSKGHSSGGTRLPRVPPFSSARCRCHVYLISTFAPAASIFFFISSASALVTPSLIVFGAPSTSAFASARPRPGTALRTSLITPILLVPISFKITSKVVFSSAAGAAAPPPPAAGAAAIATGAAALTPHFSSSCFTNPAISRTVSPLSCSTILSVSAIVFPRFAASESLRKIKADSHQLGQFSFLFIVGRPFPVADDGQHARPTKFSYALASAGFPSFCAFAFNNLANDAPGS